MASYELQGWPREAVATVIKNPTPDQFSPERKVVCDWADRFTEADRLDELEYPYAPGCGAYPVSMSIEPWGGQIGAASELAVYPEAIITIKYSTSRSTSAAIVEWIDESEGHESASGRGLAHTGGQVLFRHEHSPLLRSGCVFHHRRNKLAVVPANAFTAVDCVNASNVYSTVLGIWWTAEMLRVRVPYVSRTWTTGGLTAYTVEQQFVYKYAGGFGWNSAYNNTTGAYGYLRDAAGNRVYDYPLSNVVLV